MGGKDRPIKHATDCHPISTITRYLSRERILELIELAAGYRDDDAMAWWKMYVSLTPSQRTHVSFDDVCAAADIHPADLVGLIVSTGMRHGQDMAELVEASQRPKVVMQLGKSAMRIEGSDKELEISHRDRVKFLEHSGFLPVPRNAGVRISMTANANAAAAASAEPSVPSFASDMESLQGPKEIVQRRILDIPLAEQSDEVDKD